MSASFLNILKFNSKHPQLISKSFTGCQVIENEREKISELKRRVQDETKKLWDQKYRSEHSKSLEEPQSLPPDLVHEEKGFERTAEDTSYMDDSFMANSSIFEER